MVDASFDPLRQLNAENYDVFGELGRDERGAPVVLVRDRTTSGLAAIKLEEVVDASGGRGEPSVVVLRTLDAGVPAGAGTNCPFCRAPVRDWRRYCGACGGDIGGTLGTGESVAREELVKRLAGSSYELLGDMPRAEGGAPVHFARERTTGEIVALSVLKPASSSQSYELGVTRITSAPGAASPESAAGDVARYPAAARPGEAPAPAAPAPAVMAKICPTCGSEFDADTRFCPRDGSALQPKQADADRVIGQVIADRYHVLAMLGEGGMGRVYLAEHVKMGRRCALKLLRRELSNQPDAVGRFGREAASASRISHPNVVTIYDFGETEQQLLYIAMEYVDGQSLSALLAREGALPPQRAAGLALQAADGIAAAHAVGVVHRDLKPDNIVVTRARDGRDLVKVVDFGIAKALTAELGQYTRTGLLIGTARYMSPEQLTGDTIDGRSDLYSLGCVLYEMLVGEAPFGGPGNDASVITRRLIEPPPHPRARRPEIPDALDRLVVRALATAPANRFQTADEMRAALASLPATPATPQPPSRFPLWARWRTRTGRAEPEAPSATAPDGPRTEGTPEQQQPATAPSSTASHETQGRSALTATLVQWRSLLPEPERIAGWLAGNRRLLAGAALIVLAIGAGAIGLAVRSGEPEDTQTTGTGIEPEAVAPFATAAGDDAAGDAGAEPVPVMPLDGPDATDPPAVATEPPPPVAQQPDQPAAPAAVAEAVTPAPPVQPQEQPPPAAAPAGATPDDGLAAFTEAADAAIERFAAAIRQADRDYIRRFTESAEFARWSQILAAAGGPLAVEWRRTSANAGAGTADVYLMITDPGSGQLLEAAAYRAEFGRIGATWSLLLVSRLGT